MLVGLVASYWPLHVEVILMTSGQMEGGSWWPLNLCSLLKCYLGESLGGVLLVQKAPRIYSRYLIHSFIMALH